MLMEEVVTWVNEVEVMLMCDVLHCDDQVLPWWRMWCWVNKDRRSESKCRCQPRGIWMGQ